jgi:hypothetical protein
VNEAAPEKKKPRQPIAYTVGAPIAVVLFVSLLIGSVLVIRSTMPTGSERRDREQVVTELLRDQMPTVFPPDNAQLAGVTLYAEAGIDVVTIRVHGVLDRGLQSQIIQTLREARSDGTLPSAVVEFYYPEARPEGIEPDSPGTRIPIHSESPKAFRVEQL